jgi:hypothetical protein
VICCRHVIMSKRPLIPTFLSHASTVGDLAVEREHRCMLSFKGSADWTVLLSKVKRCDGYEVLVAMGWCYGVGRLIRCRCRPSRSSLIFTPPPMKQSRSSSRLFFYHSCVSRTGVPLRAFSHHGYLRPPRFPFALPLPPRSFSILRARKYSPRCSFSLFQLSSRLSYTG